LHSVLLDKLLLYYFLQGSPNPFFLPKTNKIKIKKLAKIEKFTPSGYRNMGIIKLEFEERPFLFKSILAPKSKMPILTQVWN